MRRSHGILHDGKDFARPSAGVTQRPGQRVIATIEDPVGKKDTVRQGKVDAAFDHGREVEEPEETRRRPRGLQGAEISGVKPAGRFQGGRFEQEKAEEAEAEDFGNGVQIRKSGTLSVAFSSVSALSACSC